MENGKKWKMNANRTESSPLGRHITDDERTLPQSRAFSDAQHLVFAARVYGRARTRRVGNEHVRVRNAEHDIEELRVHRSDSLIVEVVHHRNASHRSVSERAEPAPFFGIVVVFPVRGEHAGILECIRANNRLANEMRVVRDFDAVEAVVDVVHSAHFGLEVVVVGASLTEEVDGVEVFLVGAILHLFEERSAFFSRIVSEVSSTVKLHFRVELEGVSF